MCENAFEENNKGSIEKGKLADFTILSHDIMSITEDRELYEKLKAEGLGHYLEIQEVIVAANMYEEVDYCPSDNLEELNQEDISDDLSITNTTPSSNDIISLYPNN